MMTIPDFKREVREWADEIGVRPKEIHVRRMTRKWGSCSSRGRLTFSYEFLNRSYEERAAVIVHELLHLRYPTHNKFFKSLWSAYLGRRGIRLEQVRL